MDKCSKSHLDSCTIPYCIYSNTHFHIQYIPSSRACMVYRYVRAFHPFFALPFFLVCLMRLVGRGARVIFHVSSSTANAPQIKQSCSTSPAAAIHRCSSMFFHGKLLTQDRRCINHSFQVISSFFRSFVASDCRVGPKYAGFEFSQGNRQLTGWRAKG